MSWEKVKRKSWSKNIPRQAVLKSERNRNLVEERRQKSKPETKGKLTKKDR